MSTVHVRISEDTHALLREMARQVGASMQSVVEKAIEKYRRELFIDNLNRDFHLLKADAAAWEDEQAERDLWSHTLLDGSSQNK